MTSLNLSATFMQRVVSMDIVIL